MTSRIIEDAPVICMDCDFCDIRGEEGKRYIYCLKEKRRTGNYTKPKWCPFPLYEDQRSEILQERIRTLKKKQKQTDTTDES